MFVLKAFLRPGQKNVVFFGAQTVIWEAWCLHFGTLGSYFAILGAPGRHWEQQGGHVGIQGRISVDFGMIWGPF